MDKIVSELGFIIALYNFSCCVDHSSGVKSSFKSYCGFYHNVLELQSLWAMMYYDLVCVFFSVHSDIDLSRLLALLLYFKTVQQARIIFLVACIYSVVILKSCKSAHLDIDLNYLLMYLKTVLQSQYCGLKLYECNYIEPP